MTTPTSGAGPSGSPGSPGSPADPGTVEALQAALSAEHAAVWSLQLVTAFVDDETGPGLTAARTAHQVRRDTVERMIADRGGRPVPAEPAYATPEQVTDQASALVLVATAETDVAAAWRSVVERTDDTDVRALALESLTDAAVRVTRLRGTTTPFPGTPG